MGKIRKNLVDRITDKVKTINNELELLQVAAEMIDTFSEGFNWTGFYMMVGDHLEVGPYIGPRTDHVRIELSDGICGAAASQKKTVNIDDVRSDPRFLACSVSTRSEIVVPLMDGDECLGEIDIDSNQPAYFTQDDREMLEAIAGIVTTRLIQLRSGVNQ